ncbi:amino acid permease [uncultured Aquimarina sp.]|uniref:APC family permease n=1 Tax=uncultured Aquimarina sp. TaxID=575652 RepID=UPI00263857E7|nr:amino acid permease [uncultured Aquimarina sp.]
MSSSLNKIGWLTAASLVIANMIGTGVFTSLGFQLVNTTNTYSIILLWSLGAIMALCGALSYSELGTLLKRSGGEYHFLSELYHPFVGYLSGWVSLTVGFAAPIALAAIALGKYTSVYIPISESVIAVSVVIIVTIVHLFSIKQSSKFQDIATFFKVALIVGFIIIGLSISETPNALDFSNSWTSEVQSTAFAVSLIYVSYSYSGWNASAYIVDEIRNVRKNLPKALLVGTLVVSVLYILLQIVFLKSAPLHLLSGKVEVGQVAATQLYGELGGTLLSTFIALMLISSISAMVWVGSRVSKTIGEDYKLWKFLGKTSKNKIPVNALWIQLGVTILLILTGTFEIILVYSGILLQVFVTLSVIGVFIMRRKYDNQDAFKTPLYPIPQIIFLLISAWIIIYLSIEQPMEYLIGAGILSIGAITYFINKKMKNNENTI